MSTSVKPARKHQFHRQQRQKEEGATQERVLEDETAADELHDRTFQAGESVLVNGEPSLPCALDSRTQSPSDPYEVVAGSVQEEQPLYVPDAFS